MFEFTETTHPASEFGKFPWDNVMAEGCTRGNWSFGRGGHGFSDSTWTIKIFSGDIHSDVWAVPEPLAMVFKILQNNAADDVRRTIKNALEYAASPFHGFY